MTFVKINAERTQIEVTVDQSSILNLPFTEIVGVHYDKHAISIWIWNNKTYYIFKGFWEKDLINLGEAVQYWLKNFMSKDKYKFTTEADIELCEYLHKQDYKEKVEKFEEVISKFNEK